MSKKNKKDNKYQIAVIPGDGIGKEVMEATISVLDELDVDFDYVYGIAGDECNEEHGTPLPQETILMHVYLELPEKLLQMLL